MGEKITFIFKEKNFSFLRVAAGKMVEMGGWGGNRLNYGKNEKNVNWKGEVKNVIGILKKLLKNI